MTQTPKTTVALNAILYVTDHKCGKRNVQQSQVESGGKDVPDGVRGAAPAWGRRE